MENKTPMEFYEPLNCITSECTDNKQDEASTQ